MKTNIRNFSEITNDTLNLSAEFNIEYPKKLQKYKKFLNKTCKGQKLKPLSKVIEPINRYNVDDSVLTIKSNINGEIEIMSGNDVKTSALVNRFKIIDTNISLNYLLWYFSNEVVKDYLLCFSSGMVISSIPKSKILELEIPEPKGLNLDKTVPPKIIIGSTESPFRKLLNVYYQDYLHNFKQGNLMTASILSGAIVETLLLNFLEEIGINEKILHKKTLGQLIEIVEVYLFSNPIEGFPVNHLKEVQKLRNKAIHPKLALNDSFIDGDNLGKSNFDGFNNLVKFFGL